MFKSARIKLTAWYLLIIMFISLSFSLAMYRVLTSELDRVERTHRLRLEYHLPEFYRPLPSSDFDNDFSRPLFLDPALITETKNRLKIILAAINFAILAASAIAGYFLAGRTLKPIAEMVEDQRRFVADASHELRTPLTSLKTEIEVSLRQPQLTIKEAQKLLQSNLEEVNHLQVLSDNLIKLHQYQKGNNGLSLTHISLKPIIAEAIKKVSPQAKMKKISLVHQIYDYSLVANQPALIELFTIFLDNAIKYSPPQSQVKLTSAKTDGHILVHIADQGIGIDPKDLPHLFDRFYRADKSRTKSAVDGFGLGLSIAKQIIERHHGSIKVQTKLHQGTTFTIQIPQKQKEFI